MHGGVMPRLTFGLALDFGSKLRPLATQLERQSALLEVAEASGFAIVAAGEMASPGGFHLPNAFLVLAALAPRTGLRLCTGIALLPAWPAWRLALDAAELDQLSGGRLILGTGLGSTALRQQTGWASDTIGETADETLEALHQLWSGAAEYAGRHVQARGALPIRPVSDRGVPIWVGGSIRRSAVRAARLGDGWYAGVSFRLSQLPRQTQTYRTALGGRDGAVAINRVTLVAATPGEVEQRAQHHLASTLRAYVRPGESIENVLEDVVLVGTPSAITAQLERYHDAGVSHVLARVSLDDTPPDVARDTIELLGREVLPHFA
jgi:alkanesulfonate monooxygenase SsuD/methylene tetrahydromethanopterin reductase-like flavin-dependent oxidoreductase (luciferase family)